MDSAGVVQAGPGTAEKHQQAATGPYILLRTMLDMMDQDLNKDHVSS